MRLLNRVNNNRAPIESVINPMGTLWGKGAVGVEVGTKNYDPIFKVGVLLAPSVLYSHLEIGQRAATGTHYAYFLGNSPARLQSLPTRLTRNASRRPQKGPRRRSGSFLG